MNDHLHPIFQQALAPFVRPARVLKAGAGNRSLSPMVTAKVYQVGKNKYVAAIQTDRKTKYLGLHETPEQAHAACLKAKHQLHEGATI